MILNEQPGRERTAHRLSALIGLPVLFSDEPAGFVNDVRMKRLADKREAAWRSTVAGLVVGGRHVGSLLGYDRSPEQGQLLERVLVRLLYRNAGHVDWDDVEFIDWEAESAATDHCSSSFSHLDRQRRVVEPSHPAPMITRPFREGSPCSRVLRGRSR